MSCETDQYGQQFFKGQSRTVSEASTKFTKLQLWKPKDDFFCPLYVFEIKWVEY